MEITFYGVRGSAASPPSPGETQAMLAEALYHASQAGVSFGSAAEASAWLTAHLPQHERAGYGGDTTCFLIRCGELAIIVDAGTGIRRLGQDLMAEAEPRGRLDATLLFTHMHLDHIQGLPFFEPLFVPRDRFPVSLKLYGGATWQENLQSVLTATVSLPLFPTALEQLQQEAASVEYHSVCDRLSFTLGREGQVKVHCRRLHHPVETYGWRIEYEGKAFVVATDTEPYAGPDPVLAELVAGADVLYVDAQYDRAQYAGEYDGKPRVGWGHGYAEWCGTVARDAGVRLAVMGHHDPAASYRRIHEVGEKMRAEFPNTVVGGDGLQVRITDQAVIAAGAVGGGDDLVVKR